MMKMILATLSMATTVFAQAPDTAWTRVYEGNTYEFANSVIESSDGGYVICGYTRTPAWDTDVFLMKTDAEGDISWTRTYGGSEDDGGAAVRQTQDNGFVIAGHTSSFGAGYNDIYLIKTDHQGNELWTNTFGGDSTDFGSSVRVTSDGGYLISGQTYLFGPGEMDAVVIKTDSLGQEIWSSTFGGLAGEVDRGFAAVEVFDDGYMFLASKGAFGPDPEDIWLIRLNNDGDSLWSEIYGGEFADRGFSLDRTLSGGYFISGLTFSFESASYDFYLIVLDEHGEVIFSNTYGGFDTDLGVCGQQTLDGGYLMAGYTWSFSQGEDDAYLVRTDQSGEMLWDFVFGGTEIDVANSCIQSSDGGYLITGYTYSFGDNTADIFLVKLESDITGIDDSCVETCAERMTLSRNHPNPFNATTTIGYTLPEQGDVSISIYNLLGQQVATLFRETQEVGEHTITWDARDFPSGVYFARLEAGGHSENIKMVLLK